MQKLLKLFLILVGSLFTLLIAATITITLLINPNDFKSTISEKFHTATSKYLVLKGDIRWSFFPWLALQVNDVEIRDNLTSQPPLIKIEQAKIQTKFLPLLKKEIAINSLKINNLKLNSNGKEKAHTYDISELTLKSQPIKTGHPFALNLQFTLDSAAPKLHSEIDIYSEVTLNKNNLNDSVVHGKIRSDALQFEKFTATDLDLNFNYKNKLIKLNPINAKVYQGDYAGSAMLDLNGNTTKIISDSHFTNIQAAELFEKLVNTTKLQITGLANLTAHLIMQDETKSLNGHGNFSLNNGVLKGIDIPYWINAAEAMKNKTLPNRLNTNQTDFGNLTGTFVITNGIYSNQDLLVQTHEARATGKGTINLVNQQINYQLILQQWNNGQPKGTAIPLKITGNLANPSILVDIQSILDQELKNKIKVKLSERLQKSLGKELGDQISNEINKFFH